MFLKVMISKSSALIIYASPVLTPIKKAPKTTRFCSQTSTNAAGYARHWVTKAVIG
ncbi:Hypothetical predicted protein, partial [Octopus vulgaris]